MLSKKIYERINFYRKSIVHDRYSRIVDNFKNYESISRKKMLDEIYKVYEDPNNIVDICTTRELKYLKMILDEKTDVQKLTNDRYTWEIVTLRNKFLLLNDYTDFFIPDEIIDRVKEAIKLVDWDLAKKKDSLNEILVSYCKIQGSALLPTVVSFVSSITGIEESEILSHVQSNRVFKYYVLIYEKFIDSIDMDIPVALYQDYYYFEDELDEERKKQGIAGVLPINLGIYRTLFYNDFDKNNPKIKKFLEELNKMPFLWLGAINTIKMYAVLNIDREPLKKSIASIPDAQKYNLTKFFKILDEAMDEMPSGALNGFTPNQAKKIKLESEKIQEEKIKKYSKQENACLSSKDAKLFYKIYFALLEFTNNKYKINPKLKIYEQLNLDPYDLTDIIEKLWNNKEILVKEFCLKNPYKFNNEELSITSEFSKGIRGMYIIAKFEKEYTAFLTEDRAYMVKGINDNIDNVISFEDLPAPVVTSIIPFKGVLIYDGILSQLNILFGNNFEKTVERDYSTIMKYYHL